jgi:Xaa-Pro dipeptidase
MKTKKTQEIKHDYTARILKLQQFMKANGLDAFIVSTQDSIYYLSGASYMPVERPFFIIVRPEGIPDLVVPQLEYDHMRKVEGFGDIKSYFEYPSVENENWYDQAQLHARRESCGRRRARLFGGKGRITES